MQPISGPGMKKTGVDGRQTSVVAPQCSTVVPEREAKRVRLLNFWAKRRIVQKLFSICMIVWISLFVYQTGLLESALFKQLNSEPFLAGGEHIDNRTAAAAKTGYALHEFLIHVLRMGITSTTKPGVCDFIS